MTEMTCAQARDLASDLIDGELDDGQAEVVMAHVEHCANCPALYRALATVVAALRRSGGRSADRES